MSTKVYKLLTREQWNEALEAGRFEGAPVDLADGYIHLSDVNQVRETASKHFRNSGELILAAFEEADLGSALKWEVSRGGALFPHLYGLLDPALATDVLELSQNEDGTHTFPVGF